MRFNSLSRLFRSLTPALLLGGLLAPRSASGLQPPLYSASVGGRAFVHSLAFPETLGLGVSASVESRFGEMMTGGLQVSWARDVLGQTCSWCDPTSDFLIGLRASFHTSRDEAHHDLAPALESGLIFLDRWGGFYLGPALGFYQRISDSFSLAATGRMSALYFPYGNEVVIRPSLEIGVTF